MGQPNEATQLFGLEAMLKHCAGREIAGPGTFDEIAERMPYDLHDARKYDVVWFTDGAGLLAVLYGDGPAYSDVTPDPQWEASVEYYAVTRKGA